MPVKWLVMVIALNGYFQPDWSVHEFPNPTSGDGSCGFEKGLSKWVCDPDRVLSSEEFNNVEEALKTINLMSDSHCGDKPIQVAVAIVRELPHSGSIDIAGKNFARGLHDVWGVGDSQCQNGVLYFLSKKDRFHYMSRGDGLKTVLSDPRIRRILNTATPSFKSGLYGKGAVIALSNLAKALGDRTLLESWEDTLWKVYLCITVVSLFLDFCTKIGQFRTGPNRCLRARQTIRPFRLLWLFLVSLFLPWVFYDGEIVVAFVIQGIQLVCAGIWWKSKQESEFKRKLSELDAQRRNKKFGTDNCPICLQDISDPDDKSVLLCGHNFHHDCIEQWYITSGQNRCPICRRRNDPNEDFGTIMDDKPDESVSSLRHRNRSPEHRTEDGKEEKEDSPPLSSGLTPAPTVPPPPAQAPYWNENKDEDRFNAEKPASSQQEQEPLIEPGRPQNWGRNARHYAELGFRLMRLHYYYPSYITREEADRWARPSYSGRGFTQDSSYLEGLRKKAAERAARSSSRGSYGGSFGGGSSGGGAGGRW